MNRLTVLYDPNCALCRRCIVWLTKQPKYFAMDFLPQGTHDTARRYPALNVGPDEAVSDLIAVGDDGKVYRNTRAWVMCFYVLREYRPLAMRLSSPMLMPFARRAYQMISNRRLSLSQWFGDGRRLNDEKIVDTIKAYTAPVDDVCGDHRSGHCAIDAYRKVRERAEL